MSFAILIILFAISQIRTKGIPEEATDCHHTPDGSGKKHFCLTGILQDHISALIRDSGLFGHIPETAKNDHAPKASSEITNAIETAILPNRRSSADGFAADLVSRGTMDKFPGQTVNCVVMS
jgi:hypothetical protein